MSQMTCDSYISVLLRMWFHYGTVPTKLYSNFRNYAPPLDVKGGIITEKVFPVFSESFFWTCFGLVMYIWVLMDVTEKLAFQMWKK